MLPWSHITFYCNSARFCNAVSFAEKTLRHSRCWKTAGSKSLVSVTSIFHSQSGDQELSQGCKMCSMKTSMFLICRGGGQNTFLMLVWKFDFPWGVSLYTGIKYNLLCTALVHEAADLVLLIWPQLTRKLRVCYCSWAIHMLQLSFGRSVNLTFVSRIIAYVARLQAFLCRDISSHSVFVVRHGRALISMDLL